ncbi:hypothetical protein TRICI_004602 [Trichomonascus ciferrii]|uniref:Uncharacterized protein n=1 Tax=Trichomonascus ciferrii TaxID=44093 RepID=A0A642V5F5_9ASCO|nr:hypothetical protein TRICI_004602 [Trichomonascus ciferrii]
MSTRARTSKEKKKKEKEEEKVVNVGELSKEFLSKFVSTDGTREGYRAMVDSEWDTLRMIEQQGFKEEGTVLEQLLSFVLLYIRVECGDEESFKWNIPEIDAVERLLTSVKQHLVNGRLFCVAQYYRNVENGNSDRRHTELTVVNQTLKSRLNRYCLLLCAALELSVPCDDILFPVVCRVFSAASSRDYLNPYSTVSLSTICSVPILELHRSVELSLFLKNTLLPACDQNKPVEIPHFDLHPLFAQLIKSNI